MLYWYDEIVQSTQQNSQIYINFFDNYVEPQTFTVTFVDFDDTVLKTESVEIWFGATPPINDPVRSGFLFMG